MDETPQERPYHSLSVIPDIDQRIIEGIVSGKTLVDLANQYQCDDMAILRRAQKHPDYAMALQASVQSRMERREKQLESAGDNVGVTRSDRLLGHARWLAERSCPDRWGAKQFGGGQVNVQVVIQKPGDATVVAVQDVDKSVYNSGDVT